MFAYPANEALLELVRAMLTPADDAHLASGSLASNAQDGAANSRPPMIACTKVDGVLVCRAVGSQADAVRRALASIWSLIRPHVAGRAATPPRIWST